MGIISTASGDQISHIRPYDFGQCQQQRWAWQSSVYPFVAQITFQVIGRVACRTVKRRVTGKSNDSDKTFPPSRSPDGRIVRTRVLELPPGDIDQWGEMSRMKIAGDAGAMADRIHERDGAGKCLDAYWRNNLYKPSVVLLTVVVLASLVPQSVRMSGRISAYSIADPLAICSNHACGGQCWENSGPEINDNVLAVHI